MALSFFKNTKVLWDWLGLLLNCILTKLIVSAWNLPFILTLTLVNAENTSKLAENAITKSLIISKVFLKEVFKLFPRYRIFDFRAMFLLMPLLNHIFMKKQSGKKDLV